MKCSFCKTEIPKGTGKQLIKNDGRIYYFCSTKCEKNLFKLKRKARETRWTLDAAQAKKEISKTEKSGDKEQPANKRKKAGKKQDEE